MDTSEGIEARGPEVNRTGTAASARRPYPDSPDRAYPDQHRAAAGRAPHGVANGSRAMLRWSMFMVISLPWAPNYGPQKKDHHQEPPSALRKSTAQVQKLPAPMLGMSTVGLLGTPTGQ